MELYEYKGLSPVRIETLCDGVFAIALTLLILDIKVPETDSHNSLLANLMALWPQLAAYVVSFLVISVYWVGHHYQFHFIKKTDRTMLWLNIFFLMSIAFVPFSTSLLAAYNSEIIAVFVYGANVIFTGLMLYWHWAYASKQKNLILQNIPADIKETIGQRILLGVIFYMVSTLMALFSTKISLVLFAALPFLYMRPSRNVDSHIKA